MNRKDRISHFNTTQLRRFVLKPRQNVGQLIRTSPMKFFQQLVRVSVVLQMICNRFSVKSHVKSMEKCTLVIINKYLYMHMNT